MIIVVASILFVAFLFYIIMKACKRAQINKAKQEKQAEIDLRIEQEKLEKKEKKAFYRTTTEYADACKALIDHLNKEFDRLQDYSRIQSEVIKINCTTYDLEEIDSCDDMSSFFDFSHTYNALIKRPDAFMEAMYEDMKDTLSSMNIESSLDKYGRMVLKINNPHYIEIREL